MTLPPAAGWLRLALFPLGYGLTGALVGGTLNRVMIAELGLPATLVGIFFAVPLVESPVRLWLGYRSDGYPVLGLRREPYVVAGALLAGLGLVAATWLVVGSSGATTTGLVAGGLLAFALYGFGRNLGHAVFQALLADVFSGHQRARAVTGYELASLLGLVVGSGALGRALEAYDPARLLAVSVAVAALFLGLGAAAVARQEPRGPGSWEAAVRAREVPFGRAVREFLATDPQARRFFALALLTVLGTMAQDVLLEPYGALVLGMSVGQTTRLTLFWGLGVMGSMLLSGVALIRALGHATVLRVGLGVSIAAFAGVVASGLSGRPDLFRWLVLVMGFGTGLAGAGLLTGAIHFTTPVRAGFLMGIWGTANLVGKALGGVLGTGAVDLLRGLSGGDPFLPYAAVFGGEALLLAAALCLSLRVEVGASAAAAEARVLAAGQGEAR